MRRLLLMVQAVLVVFFSTTVQAAAQQNCSAKDIAAVVDATGEFLRKLNRSSEEKFKSKFGKLARLKGWPHSKAEKRARAYLGDKKIEGYNQEIESLLTQINVLSAIPEGPVKCERVTELKQVSNRLLALLSRKSDYLLAKLDVALAPSRPPTDKTPDESKGSATISAVEKRRTDPDRDEAKPSTTEKLNARTAPATTNPDLLPAPPLETPGTQPIGPPLQLIPHKSERGFTKQDIRDVGRGIFGTVSAELAGVINGAFQRFGQPTGYIVGREGSGAFLAGLRYGDGSLHIKDGPEVRVYWQGPSVGYDVGASGSRILFLIYNLKESNAVFKRFSGIGGSAFVAGGVGITVLINDKIVIVPIRSGIGLRLGIHLTYLKFTPQRTWNPF